MNNSQVSVFIAGVTIRQDAEGRYCLNDLHRAAGGLKSHQPSDFLKTQQTKDLIEAISNSDNNRNIPVISIPGRFGGTYVVKELVYAYANWISPTFYLDVIHTYDAVVSGSFDMLPSGAMHQLDSLINKAINERLPLMVEAAIARKQLSVRGGKTAGQLWKHYGFKTKGMRGYAAWYSFQLRELRCAMETGRAEMGGRTSHLFDPDLADKAMKGGLRYKCEKYVNEREGQGVLFLVKEVKAK